MIPALPPPTVIPRAELPKLAERKRKASSEHFHSKRAAGLIFAVGETKNITHRDANSGLEYEQMTAIFA